MEMSEIGGRERFEAIAHSVRDVFWRSAGFIRERRTSVKMRSKFTIPRWNFLIDRSLGITLRIFSSVMSIIAVIGISESAWSPKGVFCVMPIFI